MKKRKLTAVSLVLAAMMLLPSGCVKKEGSSAEFNPNNVDLSSYPITTDSELSYWCDFSANLLTETDNLGNTPYAEEFEKRTGVKVKYTHPAAGTKTEAFNLLIASGELPDIMAYSWNYYSGGVQRALDDGVIIPLNELSEYTPNLNKFLEKNPEYAKMVKTDDGQIPYFPLILDGDELTVTTGPAIRQDLLDKYGLESPRTIEDWTNILRTFKENGMEKPMSFAYSSSNILFGMFSSTKNCYIDENDTIQYGAIQPEFKEALIGIKQWYDEGLLDKNIVSVDTKTIDSYILNGKTGASILSGGSGIGKYMDAAPDDEFNLVGAMYPVKGDEEGSKYTYLAFRHGGTGVAITSKCKNPALAAKMLDYAYSDEGRILANFGIEGVSYEMVDGEPKYTDLIMDNAEGKSVSVMLSLYTQANFGRELVQDPRYIRQYYSRPQQQIATREWSKGAEIARTTFALPYLSYTADESEEYITLMNEIGTYVNGMSAKFFTGVEPIDNFDAYVQTVKEMGVDRLLEIQNAAYTRYKNR